MAEDGSKMSVQPGQVLGCVGGGQAFNFFLARAMIRNSQASKENSVEAPAYSADFYIFIKP